MIKAGDDLARLIGERAERRSGTASRRRAGAGPEDRLQGRGPHRRSQDHHAVGARDRAGGGSPEGPEAGRADPLRIGARGPQQAQRADCRAQAGLRHGQCRHRPVERGAPRRRGAGAAAAQGSRRQRRGAARQARCHRPADHRQLRPPLAARHDRRGDRRGWPPGDARPARRSRPVRPHPAGDDQRLR